MRRLPAGLFGVLCLAWWGAQPVVAQPQDVDAALAAHQAALETADAARKALDALKQRRDALRSEIESAEREVGSRAMDLRIARGRGDGMSTALNRLQDEQATIRALRDQLNAIPDTPENADRRRDLEIRIRVYTSSLSQQADDFGRRRSAQMSERERARRAWGEAVARRDALLGTLQALEGEIAAARDALTAAEEELSQRLAALALLTDAAAPPHVERIHVSQAGVAVYDARWVEDTSLQDTMRGMIEELENEVAELEKQHALVVADSAGYFDQAKRSQALIGPLLDEISWNDHTNAVSVALYRWGQITLAIATVYNVVGAVRTAVAEGTAQATASGVTREVVNQLAINLTKKYAGFQWLRGQIARDLIAHQARQLALQTAWVRAAGVVAGLNTLKNGLKGAFFENKYAYNPVDLGRLKSTLGGAVDRIEEFEDQRTDFTARRASRTGFATVVLHEIGRSYQEQLNQINDIESGFWRKYGLGRLKVPDTEIAIAKAQAGVQYYETLINAYLGLARAAAEERDLIEAEIASRRSGIAGLQAEINAAPTRRMDIGVNKTLAVGASRSGEIKITFSAPLREAPAVTVGYGVVARPAGEDPGDGLPLPGREEGAVMVRMSGSGATYSGRFETKPLTGFAAETGIPIQIQGMDFAGKALDANPSTTAHLNAGRWRYHEEFKSAEGRGQGGADDWHVLNLSFEDGTSHSFVVDASGSMNDNNRMERVKQSSRAFIASMGSTDEVALWVFFSCSDIRLMVPFTRDKQKFLDVLEAVQPSGDTPLAAAITRGGSYLLANAGYDRRALIVLTDGQETCSGSPGLAAAQFRDKARIVIGESVSPQAAPQPSEPEAEEKPKPDEPEEEETPPAEVQPRDRSVWSVSERGSRRMPSIVLTRTRYHEWGRGRLCNATITEERYYAYYGAVQGGPPRWGVNPRPFTTRTIDATSCSRGKAAMDRIRGRGAALRGSTREQADRRIGRRVAEILQ